MRAAGGLRRATRTRACLEWEVSVDVPELEVDAAGHHVLSESALYDGSSQSSPEGTSLVTQAACWLSPPGGIVALCHGSPLPGGFNVVEQQVLCRYNLVAVQQ